MKKILFSFFVLASVLLLLSCETSESIEKSSEEIIQNSTIVEEEILEPVKSAAELFAEKIQGISLSIESSPKRTFINTVFKNPFTAKVVNQENQPIPDFSIIVKFPIKNEQGKITFDEKSLKSDENGIVSFTAEKPSFACNTELSFFIDPMTDDEEVKTVAEETKVSAPWQVRTNKAWLGGLIGLVDYNSREIALTDTFSSSLLLKELINNSFSNVGNFDIPRSKINDSNEVYKYVHEIVGNSVSFLVYGTIKYATPIEKVDGLYSCTLRADITCLDMKTGEILYKTVLEEKALDAADWKVVNISREKITEKLAQLLIYNM